MRDYQREFLRFALAAGVLQFGDFTLKSGRRSPYFFNAGRFSGGRALARLGRFYARAIMDAGVEFDVLFGPAYKGIALAATTAVALAEGYGIDAPFCYNRKELKDHGEGGRIVGARLRGRVLIVDDVITAGTAIGEAARLIAAEGAKAAGAVVALDRMEPGAAGAAAAAAEMAREYGIRVASIVDLAALADFMEEAGGYEEYLAAMRARVAG